MVNPIFCPAFDGKLCFRETCRENEKCDKLRQTPPTARKPLHDPIPARAK